ncbi:MAG: aminotransferase class III-fold pyridoxal phosphate-dependent enzyme [Chitinophagaceae bacterium]|jgi:neamine transaminase/2'-deamino-2'-hydroxyneamine transaminase/neomycin C transaminase|nr:aminotransferase class III-fold pyridoxal phosphate-dependent enzyme [Chitinophagaceae bacterium]
MLTQKIIYPTLNGLPIIFKNGTGPFLFDINNNKYVDFMNAKGSVILGHNPDGLTSCIEKFFLYKQDVRTGFTESIFELSSLLKQSLGYNDIAYFKTGTEAIKAAILCAIKYNKKKIILTSGYHGYDAIWGLPNGLGESNTNGIIDFFYDLKLLEKLLQAHKNEISAAVISPDPLYLSQDWFKNFNDLINHYKVILIVDEVKVGFRYSFGLYTSRFGFKPHIAVVSKAISNGFPISIVCGRHELIKGCASMTYTSFFDALTFFVTNIVLKMLKNKDYYQTLSKVSNDIISLIMNLIQDFELPIKIKHNGSIFQFILPDQSASDLFFHNSINQGIIFYPEDNQSISSAFEDNELANELTTRLTNVFKAISKDPLFNKKRKPSLEWEIKTAWNLIDGFPDMRIPGSLKAKLLNEIFNKNKL